MVEFDKKALAASFQERSRLLEEAYNMVVDTDSQLSGRDAPQVRDLIVQVLDYKLTIEELDFISANNEAVRLLCKVYGMLEWASNFLDAYCQAYALTGYSLDKDPMHGVARHMINLRLPLIEAYEANQEAVHVLQLTN